MSGKDVQIIGRVLGFLKKPPVGPVRLGIIYSSAIPASEQEAFALQTLLNGGVKAGSVILRPILIPMHRLPEARDLGAIFVTSGLSADDDTIARQGKRLGVPTLSTDLSCVTSDSCLLAFRSAPTVEIVISRAASEALGVSFIPAFRMLVREH